MEYQIIAVTKSGLVNHAGVHKLGKISHKTIVKLERKWQAWRKNYVDNHPGNYPLKENKNISSRVIIYPVDRPDNKRVFNLS